MALRQLSINTGNSNMKINKFNKVNACRMAGFAGWFLVAVAMPQILAAADASADLAKSSLPPSSVLASAATQGTDVAVDAGMFSGKQAAAFVFKRHDQLWLGLGDGSRELSEVQLPGSFVQSIKSAPKGIAVRTLVPGSDPMIVVSTSDGASVGSYLNVYAFRGQALQPLTGVPVDGAVLDFDCTAKATACRLLAWGRWTDAPTATLQVYEWNGSSFARDDADLDRYTRQKLEQMSSEAASATPTLPRARRAAAEVVIPKYVAIHDPASAVAVADQILTRLDDPASSVSTSTDTAHAAKDLADAKAGLHRLKAMGYSAQGRQADADDQAKQAQAILDGK